MLAMPMTPFHFGAGIMFKSWKPAGMSFSLFVLSNIAIDLEPTGGYLFLGDPIHGYAHTYLGATLIGALVALFLHKPAEFILSWWNTRLSKAQARWLAVIPVISRKAAFAGALIGAWSHIWLDSYMHADVMPWWPIFSDNPDRGGIDLPILHWGLVLFGVWGSLRFLTQKWDAVIGEDKTAGLVRPRVQDILYRSARRTTGALRFSIGLLVVFCTVMALMGEYSESAHRQDKFDAARWRDKSISKAEQRVVRSRMALDLTTKLNTEKPDRTLVLSWLESDPSKVRQANLYYPLGSRSLLSPYMFLNIQFDDQGRFANAVIHRE